MEKLYPWLRRRSRNYAVQATEKPCGKWIYYMSDGKTTVWHTNFRQLGIHAQTHNVDVANASSWEEWNPCPVDNDWADGLNDDPKLNRTGIE